MAQITRRAALWGKLRQPQLVQQLDRQLRAVILDADKAALSRPADRK